MNQHELIPSGTREQEPHIKRWRVVDSSEGTHIYDVDHAWKFFQDRFKPTDYSMEFETRGGKKKSSIRLFAHSAEGGSPLHIATIAVAHSRGMKAGASLEDKDIVKYNIKHYMLPFLMQEYGYTPVASLTHNTKATK
jgi:hypothetical protein